MRNFLLRVLVNAIAIAITVALLPGFHLVNDSVMTLLVVGLIFGLLNAIVKPILKILSCPLIIITLGLFILVVNGAMLMLTAALSGGRLVIDSFWWAIGGGLIMSIVGMILERLLGIDEGKKIEVRTRTEVRTVVQKSREELDRDFYRSQGMRPPSDDPFNTPGDAPWDKPKR